MTTPTSIRPARAASLLLAALALSSTPAWAGRPLTVDDANTNDKGAGHVETWFAHAPGSRVFNVAPAYAPLEGVELALTWSRDTRSKVNAGAAQVKWVFIPADENGCNAAVSLGGSREGSGGGNARFATGIGTCNFGGAGSAHLNLGVVKPSGASSVKTWGLAYEREFGEVTPHIEFFGEKGSKPTVQIGARMEILKGVQLDGTVGRSDRENLYTLGLKFQF